jgi:hypothetical protein
LFDRLESCGFQFVTIIPQLLPSQTTPVGRVSASHGVSMVVVAVPGGSGDVRKPSQLKEPMNQPAGIHPLMPMSAHDINGMVPWKMIQHGHHYPDDTTGDEHAMALDEEIEKLRGCDVFTNMLSANGPDAVVRKWERLGNVHIPVSGSPPWHLSPTSAKLNLQR